jgi:hypothetical protein
MPVKLSDLTKRERTVAVRFDGVDTPLNVTYRPDQWTPAAQARWLDAFADKRQGVALAVYVAARVVKWDLAGDDGQIIPLTELALADVDIAVLDTVVTGIITDMRPAPDDPK